MRKWPISHTIVVSLLVLALIVLHLNCAGVGLVKERYREDFYKVPRLLPHESLQMKTTFIVYSDNQARWRLVEKFLKKENWTSRKMLLFPFYELYLLGNGIIGGINWLRQVPDHGGRERRMVRDAIYIEAKRSQVAFVLNVGDMAAHDGRRPTHWATFLKENKIEQPLVEEIPFLPVIGNHERANDTTYGLANFQTIFDYPRCYTVEFTHAVLLVLDSNLISDQYQDIDDDLQDELFAKWFVSGDDDQTPSWLERQLSASEKSFNIVAMHTPPLSYGKHHHNWLDPSYGRNLLEKRQQLLRLFAEHDVQIVFSGDDHLYQHTVLQLAEGKKIHFIVGGGGSLRDPADAEALARFQHDFESKGLQVSLIRQKRMLHYYLVEVNSEELIVKVLEVTGEKEEPTRLVDEIRIANRYEKPRIKSSAQLF